MLILRLSLLLLYTRLSFSDKPCLSQSPCQCVLSNKTVINLSSVGSPEFVRFYEVPFKTNCSTTDLYSYNPCFAFDSPDKQTQTKSGHTRCTGASACVKSPGGTDGEFPEEHAIGLQKTAVFGLDKEQLYINYTVPGGKKMLKVILSCDESRTANASELSIVKPECDSGDEIILNLTSKCACADGCPSDMPSPPSSPSGLSTGSKILIAFFTILLAYLIIGIVWNYCNGSKGAELIPNLEFWNDLPTLIMEGIAFTCSCCGRQSSYGEV